MHASHPLDLDELTDQELVALTRDGHLDAYGTLFTRHTVRAVKLARYLGAGVDADDVAAEAFMAVWSAIRNGHGPRDGFIGYLLTAVRHELWRRAKVEARTFPVEVVHDVAVFDADAEPADAVRLREAYASLLPRHRKLLWQMEVEGLRPRDLAGPGLSANGVSAAGLRARVALRHAFERTAPPRPVPHARPQLTGVVCEQRRHRPEAAVPRA
jgi:DNA-directed RNA polymerase specialized sigma24 family protein